VPGLRAHERLSAGQGVEIPLIKALLASSVSIWFELVGVKRYTLFLQSACESESGNNRTSGSVPVLLLTNRNTSLNQGERYAIGQRASAQNDCHQLCVVLGRHSNCDISPKGRSYCDPRYQTIVPVASNLVRARSVARVDREWATCAHDGNRILTHGRASARRRLPRTPGA
jgi:hypothetical protein